MNSKDIKGKQQITQLYTHKANISKPPIHHRTAAPPFPLPHPFSAPNLPEACELGRYGLRCFL